MTREGKSKNNHSKSNLLSEGTKMVSSQGNTSENPPGIDKELISNKGKWEFYNHAQRLRMELPMQRAWVQTRVRELDPTCCK